MTFDNLLIERDDAVAIVTLNRPKVLNALNGQTLTELASVMASFKNDAGVRAIVLTGAGEKSFVAGADINELAVLSPVAGKEHARHGQRSTALRSVVVASSRWRARCASPPTRRGSASPRSTSG
jgi:enoyl-CoA hydratase